MKANNVPETFADLLELIKACDCFSFGREGSDLTIYVDDVPGDRRTVINCRMERLTFEVKTLCGYDKDKNRWGEYCDPCGRGTLPNRRGEKALRKWLADKAMAKFFFPNPEFFSWFKGENA